jgi:hypothetical protein
MTDESLRDDAVLRQLIAARLPLAAEDISPTGERATAILTRVLAVPVPETPTEHVPGLVMRPRRAVRGAWARSPRAMLALCAPVIGLAALVLAVTGALSGPASTGTQPAAAAVLRGVAAALTQKPGTILVEKFRVTGAWNHGHRVSWQQEMIYETPSGGGPQNSFYYASGPGAPREAAAINGNQEIYNKATNTIYITSVFGSNITPGPKPGTYLYIPRKDPPGPAATIPPAPLALTAAQAQALRDGTDTVLAIPIGKRIPFHIRLEIAPAIHFPSETDAVRQLLRTHALKVDGFTIVDGRKAIKLSSVHNTVQSRSSHRPVEYSPDGGLEYYVAPGSYDPIRQVVNRPPYVQSTQTWTEYKLLPATANNQQLLSLTARHPDAHVDRSHADYLRAANGWQVSTG